MAAERMLIAGIGNIFLGDDAFGCEVVRKLLSRPIPREVRVVDFGIRGLDLAYCLLEEFDAVILVDAVPRGEMPGTVYLIEPDISSLQSTNGQEEMIEAHSMNPEKVLRIATAMGAKLKRVLLVGCEPTPFDPEMDVQMELSEPARNGIDQAIDLIESLVREILQTHCTQPTAGAKGAML